jgi:two-component system, LytTR family, response regulator
MSIRVLLSDDEALARGRLRGLLEEAQDLEIVAECGDGKSAIALIQSEQPDLVFLDIQMPEVDGFGVVEALQKQGKLPLTIFVTAYDRYAMRAFEVHALDYLLKPVNKERLGEALDHARKQLLNPNDGMFQKRVLEMLGGLDEQRGPERIVVKSDGEIVCLKPTEIDWAESAGNYVCLHVGNVTHILRETITALENRLGARQFLRVHRSTLVNVDRIKTLKPSLYGDYAILLRDGTKLTLSRGFRETVLKRLGTT